MSGAALLSSASVSVRRLRGVVSNPARSHCDSSGARPVRRVAVALGVASLRWTRGL